MNAIDHDHCGEQTKPKLSLDNSFPPVEIPLIGSGSAINMTDFTICFRFKENSFGHKLLRLSSIQSIYLYTAVGFNKHATLEGRYLIEKARLKSDKIFNET